MQRKNGEKKTIKRGKANCNNNAKKKKRKLGRCDVMEAFFCRLFREPQCAPKGVTIMVSKARLALQAQTSEKVGRDEG